MNKLEAIILGTILLSGCSTIKNNCYKIKEPVKLCADNGSIYLMFEYRFKNAYR